MFNSIEINSDSQYKLLNIEESQYCDVKSEMIDPQNYLKLYPHLRMQAEEIFMLE